MLRSNGRSKSALQFPNWCLRKGRETHDARWLVTMSKMSHSLQDLQEKLSRKMVENSRHFRSLESRGKSDKQNFSAFSQRLPHMISGNLIAETLLTLHRPVVLCRQYLSASLFKRIIDTLSMVSELCRGSQLQHSESQGLSIYGHYSRTYHLSFR